MTSAKPGALRLWYYIMGEGRGHMVAVAQSVRAPVCGTGGCGFNSRQPPSAKVLDREEFENGIRSVAQLVEHRSPKPAVAGSIPAGPVKLVARNTPDSSGSLPRSPGPVRGQEIRRRWRDTKYIGSHASVEPTLPFVERNGFLISAGMPAVQRPALLIPLLYAHDSG